MGDRRRAAWALASGGALVLAFPGADLWPLAFVALVPLYVALDGEPPTRAWRWGALWGVAFFLGTLWWVIEAMTVYGHVPLPLSLLALAALAVILAGYPALYAALVALLPGRGGAWALGAAALWVATEYLRSHLFTGFPWVLLGYSQHRDLVLLQVASLGGIYAVSFLVALVNAGLAALILRRGTGRRAWGGVAVAALLLALGAGYGLAALRKPPGEGPPVRVAALQGNIDQSLKWNPTMQAATLDRYQRLTEEASRAGADLIIWPETAVPFFLRYEAVLGGRVLEIARQTGRVLVVGSPDADASRRYFNSAFLVGPDGRLLAKYDKIHLVPFGEYVPLHPILFFVHRLAEGIGDFTPGQRPVLFPFRGARFGVNICYEAIFPEEVRRAVAGGAEFLVNITNDAWFGRTAAPAQHLAMAAARAVETGRYLVRSANTGISAIVDPRGRIQAATGLFVEAVVVGSVRPRTDRTLYARTGDLFAGACVAFAAALVAAAWRGRGGPITPEERQA